MTVGHLLIGLQLEEGDLIRDFGERYQRYREQVPMFIPRLSGRMPQQRDIKAGKSSR
jgi:protein-S-isoprenylcysteine O-methyltransferase Ste14